MKSGEKWVIGGAAAAVVALVGYELYEKFWGFPKNASATLKGGAMPAMRVAKGGVLSFTTPDGSNVTGIDSGSVPGSLSSSGGTATFLAGTTAGSGTLTITWGSASLQSTIPVTVG